MRRIVVLWQRRSPCFSKPVAILVVNRSTHGHWRQRSSQRITPKENTSAVSEYLSADNTSGAIHCTCGPWCVQTPAEGRKQHVNARTLVGAFERVLETFQVPIVFFRSGANGL